jgi:hypothetical protein
MILMRFAVGMLALSLLGIVLSYSAVNSGYNQGSGSAAALMMAR